MSQPAVAGPPGATQTAPDAAAPEAQQLEEADGTHPGPVQAAQAAEPPISYTPRRLRQLMLVVVAGGLLYGLLGALAFGLQAQALSRADANTAQLIRVQAIQTNLLSADAMATNAFLVGGLEPPEQRQRYDDAIDSANQLIAEAAQHQPADAEALAKLNAAISEYATSVEQARANNRQGYPVGAQYLREAGTKLRTEATPILDSLVATNTHRAEAEMAADFPLMFQIIGVVILIGFVFAMVWVARRFKRTINVGLLVASLSLLLSLIIGGIFISAVSGAVNQLRDGSFTSVTAAAEARIEANNAKANESLTLIARGSGAAFEEAWVASAEDVERQLAQLDSSELERAWEDYSRIHTGIREADDGGEWDAAVQLATGTDGSSSNAAFQNFDTALADFIAGASEQTTSGLSGPRSALIVGAVLVFAAGVVATLFGRWGVAVRLKEYR